MIDLHVHSNKSDGTFSPAELVTLAVKTGLSAFALTDHDTMSGIKEAREAVQNLPSSVSLQLIPGIEISAGYKDRDIHILGLYLDDQSSQLTEALKASVERRERRNEEMVSRFHALNIPISIDEMKAENPDVILTRAHFARYLLEHHYVKTQQEAFLRYLGYQSPCYVKREYIKPEEAIEVIQKAGGLASLAHPLLYELPSEELLALIKRLKSAGLAALEVFYSSNTSFDQQLVLGYANRFGLLQTGGSDFHGENKPNLLLGTGRGNNLNIPDKLLPPLEEHLFHYKKGVPLPKDN